MILPRRLMRLADGRFCEEHDPQQAMNFRPKGFIISDAEAEKIGLKAYLDQTGYGEVAMMPQTTEAPAEAKAVDLSEVENKAVEPTEVEAKMEESPALEPGLHIDPALRRGGRRA